MELVQIAQHAEDLERATAFYQLLLDERPIATFQPPGLVFFRLGRTRLLLDRVAPSALLYIGVADVRTRIDELASRGVTVDTEPHVIFTHEDDSLGPAGRDEWQAFIKDSEGNLVGLVSHHPT
jgi:predicted enzyme related to lactoylglutathione lyase